MSEIIDMYKHRDIPDLNGMLDYNYQNKRNIEKHNFMLYELLIKADKYVKRKRNGSCFNYNVTKINMISQIPKPAIYDTSFFPKEIQTYIDDNAENALTFRCKIKDRTVSVTFTLFDSLQSETVLMLSQSIYKIYMWVYILDSFSSDRCSKNLNLYVYLTPFKKSLPNNQLTTLDSVHVNSGFTTGCREDTDIVLYRSEEWFKVFIHETFHNFGLDFSDMNLSHVNKKMQSVFNMNIEYNIYESYCETWARIINTMFYTYLSIPSKKRSDYSLFNTHFTCNMNKESSHSLYQLSNILSFLDLRYDNVTTKSLDNATICNHLYRENTSVFSYYIISGLLMNNYKDFIHWCYTNNNMMIKFKKTPTNLDKYIDIVYKSSRNKNVIKNINSLEYNFVGGNLNVTPSMKMSSLDTSNTI